MFSAGYDIGGIPDESFAGDAEALVAHPFHAAMEAISAHPFPVVAAINGHASAAASSWRSAATCAICAEGAKLGMPPAKLGLIYGHTGLRRFIEVIGVARTKELFLVGRNIDAARAEAIGLVNRVVARDELEQAGGRAGRRDRRATRRSPTRGNKRAIETLARNPRARRPSRSASWSSCGGRASPPRTSARASSAFAEKRKPRWQGR